MSWSRKPDLLESYAGGAVYSLKRVRPSATPGEFMAEMHTLRFGKWVVIGVLQLTEAEWGDLRTLFRAVGFEVSEEMRP